MYAELWLKNGPYAELKTHRGNAGSEVLSHKFTDLQTGEYVLLVGYDFDGNLDLEFNEPGVTTAPFFYRSGEYEQIILDAEGDWGSQTVTNPNP
jgi:uncharacterized protein (DUF2141 family)